MLWRFCQFFRQNQPFYYRPLRHEKQGFGVPHRRRDKENTIFIFNKKTGGRPLPPPACQKRSRIAAFFDIIGAGDDEDAEKRAGTAAGNRDAVCGYANICCGKSMWQWISRTSMIWWRICTERTMVAPAAIRLCCSSWC